jgi:transposase
MRVDGDKRHVLHNLDTGFVRAVGLAGANAIEATVTEAIRADLACQHIERGELHIDRAHLRSTWVRQLSAGLKAASPLDREHLLIYSPDHGEGPCEPGGMMFFPAQTCAGCPLRERWTTSAWTQYQHSPR